ncbi:VOC family protein [Dysgonomonas sp. OttesenSCG-928-M03]|nr:VOC family protein [Dysgonomonas sp. OttesenSCG-928-M03]
MKRYDNFFLPAKDLEESKKFYNETLGLNLKFEFEKQGMAAYHVGEEEPAIILKDISMYPNFQPTIWFEVENVKETYEKLKNQGISFTSEPFRIRTGWAVEFLDPSGNRLGITDYTNE